MKHIYAPLLGVFFCLNGYYVNAQQLLSTAGGDVSGVAWAVGEMVGGQTQTSNFNIFQGILANEEFMLPVGFEEYEQSNHLMVWPNPVTDYVNIRVTEANLPVVVCVYSLAGVLVTRFLLHSEQISQPLSSLTPGMYYLRLTDLNDKLLATKKIIKL